MKIFLFNKTHILNFFIIAVISILILLYFLYVLDLFPNELVCSSQVSNEFINKVSNLTNGNEKVAYLTFDDGPNNSVTPKILDILKSENIKASFFVIGKYVESYPDVVKRAYDEGHYIANHSYNHNNSVLYKDSKSFMDEVVKTDLAIGKAIGIDDYCSHVFRFPNGFMAPMYKKEKEKAVSLLGDMNYAYIDWNCLNNDSMKKYSNVQLLDNLKKSCKNKDTLVVLMHDTKDVSDSSLVLKDSILYLKSEGYVFKNFYEI